MRKLRERSAAGIVALSAFILTGSLTLTALAAASPASPLDLSALQLVDSNAIPRVGNFYYAQNYGMTPASGLDAFGPPLPADFRPDLPLYSLGNGNYVIDDYGVDYAAESAATSRGEFMTMDSGDMMSMFSFSTNDLWLEMTGVSNGLAYLNLHNATNPVYEILTKTNLSLTNWTTESEVWPTNSTAMPFNISELARTNLFVWAMDWTGVTENGNTTPDWWFWKYFGTTSLVDGDFGSQGQTLLYDYQNKLDPNSIVFSLQFTNYNVRSSPANGIVSISAGIPASVAILVNDTNLTDAVWQPYISTNIGVPLSSGNGIYTVSVGLRGLPVDARQTWVNAQLNFSNTAPVLTFTNPVSSSVSVPMIQLQGLVSASLSRLTYDVSNAAGIFTNQQGYWQPLFYDDSLQTFTTNSFQCYDIALTNGLNVITLHATDVAGNTATTNVSYTLDYSGDHTAPVLTVIWPTNGTSIAGSSFTAQAQVDDATATVTATINSNIMAGLVERNGTVWLNNLSLNSGTNILSITATDAAGNVSTTNLNVIGSAVSLTVNPLSADQLNQSSATVTGTIGDSSQKVTVNGVAATVSGNNWSAANVPVSPDGTASLKAQVGDSDNNPLAEQDVYQPQPAKIVPSSYTKRYHANDGGFDWIPGTGWFKDPTATTDNVIHWTFAAGGSWYYNFEPNDIEDPPDIEYYTILEGADGFSSASNYFVLSWENAAVATSYDIPGAFIHPYELIGNSYDQIQTHLMIDAAGQPKAGQTTLYLVQAQVTNKDTGIQIAGNELQIQGTTMTDMTHGDGSVWSEALVSAPAGVNADVTPTPAQPNVAHNDNLNVSGQECKLTIMASVGTNGVALDPDKVVSGASFVVGQNVVFSVTNLPPGTRATNFEWSFEGNYFNNHSNAVPTLEFPTCSTNPYVDPSMLAQNTITNWWVSGGPDASTPAPYTASVKCDLILSNNSIGKPCTTEGRFSMKKPQANIIATTSVISLDTNQLTVKDGVLTNDLGLHYGVPRPFGTPGITFSNVYIMPISVSGTFQWVQVIESFALRYQTNDSSGGWFTLSASNVLDTSYPYLNNVGAANRTEDSPGANINKPYCKSKYVTDSRTFRMYLEFQPSEPTNSQWVPLRSVLWHYSGEAVLVVTNCATTSWVGTNFSANSNPTDSPADGYPLWTNNILNFTNFTYGP